MTVIAGLILAAGRASRMGRDKRLLEIGGVPMVMLALQAARQGGLDPVLVVTGPEPLTILPAEVTSIRNPAPDRGMASSLALGIAALPAEVAAVVVLLADMPKIAAHHVSALVAAFADRPGNGIVVPLCHGRRGNPVLLARRFFAEMQDMTGDKGARGLLLQHADQVTEIAMDDAVLTDLDTPEDVRALECRP